MRNKQSINLIKNIMSDFIENICLLFIIICIVGLLISLVTNNIVVFSLSVLFMFAFGAIALIDISRK